MAIPMTAIQIYTTTYCGYCVAAKRLLTQKGLSFEEIDVTNAPETRDWLIQTTGAYTVPQIFIFGRPIGGYQELAAVERSGQLEVRLAAGPNAAF
jgi:GrxC family glutaredoxin